MTYKFNFILQSTFSRICDSVSRVFDHHTTLLHTSNLIHFQSTEIEAFSYPVSCIILFYEPAPFYSALQLNCAPIFILSFLIRRLQDLGCQRLGWLWVVKLLIKNDGHRIVFYCNPPLSLLKHWTSIFFSKFYSFLLFASKNKKLCQNCLPQQNVCCLDLISG